MLSSGKDQRELLIRDDRDVDAFPIDVDADERSAIDDGVCRLGRRSTVLQHLLEPSAVCLVTEKRVGLVLIVAKSVDVVIGTILPNNRRGGPKSYSVAVEMIASAQTRGIRFDELSRVLSTCIADWANGKNCSHQKEQENYRSHNVFVSSSPRARRFFHGE